MQWLHLTGFQMDIPRNPLISYILDVTLLTAPCHILTTKIKIFTLREGMVHLDKPQQTYMPMAINTKEAHSQEKFKKT